MMNTFFKRCSIYHQKRSKWKVVIVQVVLNADGSYWSQENLIVLCLNAKGRTNTILFTSGGLGSTLYNLKLWLILSNIQRFI